MENEEQEIKKVTAAFMIMVALIFDAIQALINLIPIIGQVLSFFVSVFSFLTFYVWFKMNNVSFSNSKRALKFGGGMILEAIPVLNALPALTLSVFMIISETRMKKALSQIPGGDKVAKVIQPK